MATPPIAPVDPTTSGGTLYGLSSSAQGYQYDLTGLTGVPSPTGDGKMTGKQLLQWFLASSGSTDPNTTQIVAAIQHALLLSHAYGTDSKYVPESGIVGTEDVKALAGQLDNLYNANQAQTGVTTAPDGSKTLQGMPLATYLAGQASGGVAAGIGSTRKTAQINVPNAANIASAYQDASTKLLGHRPSPAETAAFVNSYTQQLVQQQKDNINSDYAASLQAAQPGDVGTMPLQPAAATTSGPGGPNIGPGTQITLTPGGEKAQLGSGAADVTPADLPTKMQSLQDVINAQAQASGGPPVADYQKGEAENVGVAAENFARNQHPTEAAGGDLNNTFSTFLNVIGAHMGGI